LAIPVAAKAATAILKDKRLRKILVTAILVLLGIIIVPLYLLTSITSGSFALFADSPEKIKENYSDIRECFSDAFKGLRITVSREVRDRAEAFMPDFTLCVTKARLEAAVTSYYPPIYTPEDVILCDKLIPEISKDIREHYYLLDDDPKATYFNGDMEIKLAPFYYDDEFNSRYNPDFRKFSNSCKRIILEAAGHKMQSHKFTSQNTVDGKIETLTVKSAESKKEVELITRGSGGLYIPEFLAMFQLKHAIEADAMGNGESDAPKLISDIAVTFEALDNNPAAVIPLILKSNAGKGSSLSLLDKNALIKILERGIDDGFISADIVETGNKLTIIIDTPTTEKWCEIFGIDPEYSGFAYEYLAAINMALNDVGITEEEKYLPLGDIFNFTLFSYSPGLFALPIEYTGVATAYGQDGIYHDIYSGIRFEALHEHSMTLHTKWEKNQKHEQLFLTLPPQNGCIEDVKFISSASQLKTDNNGDRYDDSEINIEYMINAGLFRRIYGFPLSSITGSNDDTQTITLTYGCLGDPASFPAGQSLYEIDKPIYLGRSHERHLKISVRCKNNGRILDPRLMMMFDTAEVKGLSPIRLIDSWADFIWAVDSDYTLITTNFGYDPWRDGLHNGIDIGDDGIESANIYAVKDGTVLIAYNDGEYHGGFGNYVLIDHGDGVQTLYAHAIIGSVTVNAGDIVKQGETIARVGNTGWSTGPHLHFEVRVNGIPIDPLGYYIQK
jgi:hypothetical protein